MKRLTFGMMIIGVIGSLSLGCCPKKPAVVGPPFLRDLGEFPLLPNYIWDPLVRTFEQQARGIPLPQWKELAAKYLANPATPVRVAVVDFAVDQAAGLSRSAHKEAVSGVIRDLLCADAEALECRARVVATPALSAREGSLREYAYMTFKELQNSLSGVLIQSQMTKENLIVNLSMGWDPIKTGPKTTPTDDPQVAGIFQLLKRASCQGAIVIAPAGNLTGSEGPLFPAGYEVQRVPSNAQCAQMGFPRRVKIDEEKTPLVYAVAGLDSIDQRMVTVRPWSQPRLAAYGLSVPASSPKDKRFMFSGSSMANSIVTAAAAAVWSAKPDLSPDQVMNIVYEGGVKLDGAYDSKRARTEFCLDHLYGPCPDPVRRVFLCGALEKVLPPEAGLSCVHEPSRTSDLPALPNDHISSNVPRSEPCLLTGCGHPFGPSIDQTPNGAVPQPGIAGCPGCTISVRRSLVFGKLTWDSVTPPTMQQAVVQTWNSSLTNPQSSMPIWDVTQDFERGVTVPSDTWGAMMTIDYIDPSDGSARTKQIALNVNKKE
jgi:hypothetical protein